MQYHLNVSWKLYSFSECDTKNISEIIVSILEDEILNDYFYILGKYHEAKTAMKLTTTQISKDCGVPELTIRRTENLRNVPNIINLMRMLNSVGLQLMISPISKSDTDKKRG